ncbi:MAG: hypothetical protein KGZ65_04010 [Sphingomonadales bacterium]|nr:hypothetical protein [Sphingomonadaceae bacterium]MBS3930377.1 hypothetical protein [Sphingomonadales bacterium]
MSDTTGMVHADPRRAEAEALAKVAPHLKRIKTRIMAWATNAGENGLTPDEFARETGALINTVRRRFVDLWKAGELKPTKMTRPNARGNPETVWVLGHDALGAAVRETKDQKIKRLEARVAELESTLSRAI